MITHAASRKQYTVLLDRPLRCVFFAKPEEAAAPLPLVIMFVQMILSAWVVVGADPYRL